MTLHGRTAVMKNKMASLAEKHWMPYVWLAIIILLAATLRFYKLGTWSFWVDEIYTIDHAMAHFGTPELITNHLPPARNWIPVSVILTAQALNFLGISEWSARLVSVLMGILTIPVLYVPVQRIFGTRVALMSMLLLAVSPWHIFWSQNARFYTALMLFYSLALFSFYFGLERNRPQYFIAFYILFYLAMSERLIAVILAPVIVAYLLLLWWLPFEKPAGLNWRNILILTAPVILLLLYEIYLFAATGDFIFASDVELLGAPIDNPVRILIVMAFNIGIPLLGLAIFNGADLVQKKDRAGLFFLIAAVVPPLVFALISPFVFIVERYAFVSLLFWIVLAASGLHTLFAVKNRSFTLISLAVIFILLSDAAWNNLLYYQINHGNRLEWREAVNYVRERMEPEDTIVSTRGPLAAYYLGGEVLDFPDLRVSDLESIQTPIWFIMDYPGIWHGRLASKEWMESNAQLMQFSYLRVPEGNALVIYRFDPGVQ